MRPSLLASQSFSAAVKANCLNEEKNEYIRVAEK